MERKKMHGVNTIKSTGAEQAKAIYNFKNTEEKLCRTNAATWYNKMFKIEDFSLL
jgi:hypothetical protein